VGDHTPVVRIGLRYGFILFIMSEVMFFAALVLVVLQARHVPDGPRIARRGRRLAAPGHRDLRPLAPAAHQHADPALLGRGRDLGAPCAGAREQPQGPEVGPGARHRLGVLFTGFQIYEYGHAAFGFAGNIYGANFFMATGFTARMSSSAPSSSPCACFA
jgi:cytochrome c oxidase subunit 3